MTEATQMPDGSQTATPPAQTPVTPEAMAQLQAKLDDQSRQMTDINNRLAEKDRKISDLEATRATLETRATQVQPAVPTNIDDPILEGQLKGILEEGLLDPTAASKKLGKILHDVKTTSQREAVQQVSQNLQPTIELQMFESRIKEDNADLMDLGMETAIYKKAEEFLPKGKQRTLSEIKDAINKAIKETRDKLKIYQKTETPAPAAPKGAQGESGGNTTPAPAKATETQPEGFVDSRLATGTKKGLW